MFTQLYLDDSFTIRKIIVAAVPAVLVAVGMSLALSEAVSAREPFIAPGMQIYQLNSGGGGAPNTTNTNTNQVYTNNRRRMPQLNINNMRGMALTGHAGRTEGG